MKYLNTPEAVDVVRSLDIQSSSSIHYPFNSFKHRCFALDADNLSGLDSFAVSTRDRIMKKMLGEMDSHATVTATFTRDDSQGKSLTTINSRKLILWQDIRDNIQHLYAAADLAQQVIASFGYNKYPSCYISDRLQLKAGKTLWAKLAEKITAIRARRSEKRRQDSDEHAIREVNPFDEAERIVGQWKYAMPYFRCFGEKLGLISPYTLFRQTGPLQHVYYERDDLYTLYQSLRGAEVALFQAISITLPESLQRDTYLRYLLDHDYPEEAINHLLDIETAYNAHPNTYRKKPYTELAQTICAVLYAILYHGARRRIENIFFGHIVGLIDHATNGRYVELLSSINRVRGATFPDDGYVLNPVVSTSVYSGLSQKEIDNLLNIESYTRLKIPVHVLDNQTSQNEFRMTGWPDLCADGKNFSDPAILLTCDQPVPAHTDSLTTPLDAVIFDMPAGVDVMRDDFVNRIRGTIKHR